MKKIIGSEDKITGEVISPFLTTKYIGRKIIHYSTVDSTNIQCKRQCGINLVEGMVVVSEEQTSGKGRLGRKWVSPKGTGIWMSVALTPNVSPMLASRSTLIGAAAVYSALKDCDINAQIKWPNDIVINGKKVCGILTEMSASVEKVNYIIMGIGINANMEDFPEELSQKATSLKNELGTFIDRKILLAGVLNKLEEFYEDFKTKGDISRVINICREGSVLINKDVKIINGDVETLCTVVDIDKDGELIVKREDGSIEKVISGEVSVRGIYGYI